MKRSDRDGVVKKMQDQEKKARKKSDVPLKRMKEEPKGGSKTELPKKLKKSSAFREGTVSKKETTEDNVEDILEDIVDESAIKAEEFKFKNAGKEVMAEVLPPPEKRGPGRPPKIIPSTYERAINLLDENVLPAIQVLADGLADSNKYYRFKCAELILKKSIADKKETKHTGPKGGPIELTNATEKDVQTAIDQVEDLIDKKIRENNRRIPVEVKIEE